MNVSESRTSVLERVGRSQYIDSLHCEALEVVDELRYMGIRILKSESSKTEIGRRVLQRRKIRGELKALVNGKYLSAECAADLSEGVLSPI